MARTFPAVQFERYCDDIIVHARSERQALQLRAAIARRLTECGLELNEQKTRTVYCKDDDRRGSYEHTSFDFLSYTFRPRLSKSRYGKHFVNFSPAVSGEAKTRLRREMRRWRVARRSDKTLTDLALMFNRQLQGWLGRRRGAVSALRLMVSSPPPAEPDMRIPTHPALHRTSAVRCLTLVRQQRSPAGWWPGLFRGPPTARGCGVRDSGSPGPRRASEVFCLRGWSSHVPSTVA